MKKKTRRWQPTVFNDGNWYDRSFQRWQLVRPQFSTMATDTTAVFNDGKTPFAFCLRAKNQRWQLPRQRKTTTAAINFRSENSTMATTRQRKTTAAAIDFRLRTKTQRQQLLLLLPLATTTTTTKAKEKKIDPGNEKTAPRKKKTETLPVYFTNSCSYFILF